jgi:hypothetical protein
MCVSVKGMYALNVKDQLNGTRSKLKELILANGAVIIDTLQ